MQAMGTTEGHAAHQEAVLDHPLDIGSPAVVQPVLAMSQEPVEEIKLDIRLDTVEPDPVLGTAPDEAGDTVPVELDAEEDEEDEDR